MRSFIAGDGSDSTSAVQAHLAANRALHLADLYVINTAPCYTGQYLGQQFLLTDYPSPLKWNYRGTFTPAVISRSGVESVIGLEEQTVDVTWSPKDIDILASEGSPLTTVLTALQGFGAGVFDNGVLEIWRCVMPTVGDCNTMGACLLFSGRIGDLEPDRLNVKISVVSRMEVLNIQVPTNLIEPTNIFAQYSTGTTPDGAPTSFTVVTGSTASKVLADGSPTQAADTYDAGFVIFQTGHLAGTYREVRKQTVESGHHGFYLLQPLPFAPTIGDMLAAFIPVPRDLTSTVGVAAFPYVPSPINSAVVIA